MPITDAPSPSAITPVRSRVDGSTCELEDRVRKVFADTFRTADVPANADFFAIGGDSLRAAVVLERIFRTLHVRLPPDVFFTCPTPRLLAKAIAAQESDRPSVDSGSIVPLSASGSGAPVYFIHGITPRPWMFRFLVPALQLRRPIYGTRAPDLLWERDVMTIEEMAVHYATEIRRVQPRGPYSLMGYSFGGVLAHAIATRLMRDGQAMGQLVLLDTTAPGRSVQWLRKTAVYTAIDAIRLLCRFGLVEQTTITRRLAFDTQIGELRSPLGRIRLALGAGPMTTAELRGALSFAFPRHKYHQTRDMSFDDLCSVIAGELERASGPKQWRRVVKRAGSAAPASLIRGQKLLVKNARLSHSYMPRSIYEGKITIYAREGNTEVNGWQRFTSQPLDVRRVPIVSHRLFIAPQKLHLYAADLRHFLDSDGHD